VVNPALVLLGSLLAVALWEFCRPRRRREFPAQRRRLGNLGIWPLNIALVAFTFAPPETFRPQLEAALGVVLPSWPIADGDAARESATKTAPRACSDGWRIAKSRAAGKPPQSLAIHSDPPRSGRRLR
jgi:hypothetical protein